MSCPACVPYPYWNLKLRDDSNILEIANSIASESSGHLFSELLSASRTNLSAVSPINTGIVFIDIAIFSNIKFGHKDTCFFRDMQVIF